MVRIVEMYHEAIEYIEVGVFNADDSPASEARSSSILDSDHCAILAMFIDR